MKLPLFLWRPIARFLNRHTGMRTRLAMLLSPGGGARQVSCYGFQAQLDPRFIVDGICLLLQEFDPDYDDFCRSFLEPGAVVVDVGCHAGITIFSALQSVGENARIYGFEPDPRQFQRCLTNMALNPQLAGRVQVVPIALSDSDGEVRFHDSGYGSVDYIAGRGHYVATPDGPVSAVSRRFDGWVAEEGLDRLDCIKCDVEGHEVQVLGGALESIERFRPLVFFEALFLWNSPSELEKILEWFRSLDYVVVGSHYPYPYLLDAKGPVPLDLIACPRSRWLALHERLMVRGQTRQGGRSRWRALVDGWRDRRH